MLTLPSASTLIPFRATLGLLWITMMKGNKIFSHFCCFYSFMTNRLTYQEELMSGIRDFRVVFLFLPKGNKEATDEENTFSCIGASSAASGWHEMLLVITQQSYRAGNFKSSHSCWKCFILVAQHHLSNSVPLPLFPFFPQFLWFWHHACGNNSWARWTVEFTIS